MESDLISRQAAIDALDKQIVLCDKALGSFDISMKDEYAVKTERASLKAYRETLNVLPSAQPERKRGKWIHGKEIAREYLSEEIARKCLSGGLIHVYEDYHCSECGYTVKNVRWNVDGELIDKYCSFCGADLRETKR